MADIIGLKVERSGGGFVVAQEIDFSEFDLDLTGRDDIKNAIAQEAIDLIKNRVEEDNTGNSGRALAGYEESYFESEIFAAFNKSKGDVNMTLTGEMMASIDVTDTSENGITIGFNDDFNNAKAHGHMTGMEGKGKVRPFFGVNKGELESIVDKYRDEVTVEQPLTAYDVLLSLSKTETASTSLTLADFGFMDDDLL